MAMLKSKVFKWSCIGVGLFLTIILTSFTTVKIGTLKFSASGGKSATEVATDVIGQVSDQYLSPKFEQINARLDTIDGELKKVNDHNAKADDREYKSLVTLIDKQYEKLGKDKFDIKIADLKEIDENWDVMPDTYKTTMVKKEYDAAMAYYMTIK